MTHCPCSGMWDGILMTGNISYLPRHQGLSQVFAGLSPMASVRVVRLDLVNITGAGYD